VDGGVGADTVSYQDVSSTAGMTIDLTANSATGGAGTDGLSNIENAIGTNRADSITGNSLRNVLTGGTGSDTLRGLDGNDRLLANDGESDAVIDCDGGSTPGTSDSAFVDANDPVTSGCETVSQVSAASRRFDRGSRGTSRVGNRRVQRYGFDRRASIVFDRGVVHVYIARASGPLRLRRIAIPST
ncbi:MAG: hypothetical protein M3290_09360, partial [Actinomycetota bacterium]|nr:hypothetical protein [Actinomycetota bacterium]